MYYTNGKKYIKYILIIILFYLLVFCLVLVYYYILFAVFQSDPSPSVTFSMNFFLVLKNQLMD